ncbi:MAG: aminodeoxychorismate lyase [Proteobacteria bacterium]|nr:aminodeoxychorismate lyase [Pseudomonadota bacterium]
MSDWFHNGAPVTSVAIENRGFQYGDGLFETIAIRGGEPRLWGHHLERLAEGCRRLRLERPDAGSLRLQLDGALQASTVESLYCTAKIIVSGGVTQRGYGRARRTPAHTLIGVFPAVPPAGSAYRDGVGTIRCRTALATGSALAGVKTLNRIEQVLARSECLEADAFEGLTFDADARLICGTMSNVFLVDGKTIRTPSLSRCGVAGVMRRHLMDVLRDTPAAVVECDLGERDLERAGEVFLTNSQFGVLPVSRCDERTWPVGPVTRDVMSLMAGNGIAECRL